MAIKSYWPGFTGNIYVDQLKPDSETLKEYLYPLEFSAKHVRYVSQCFEDNDFEIKLL